MSLQNKKSLSRVLKHSFKWLLIGSLFIFFHSPPLYATNTSSQNFSRTPQNIPSAENSQHLANQHILQAFKKVFELDVYFNVLTASFLLRLQKELSLPASQISLNKLRRELNQNQKESDGTPETTAALDFLNYHIFLPISYSKVALNSSSSQILSLKNSLIYLLLS